MTSASARHRPDRHAVERDTGSARDDLVTVLDLARRGFDLSITGTLLTAEGERPELLVTSYGRTSISMPRTRCSEAS